MKKSLFVLALTCVTLYTQAQYVSIPDTSFGRWLNTYGFANCLQGNSTVGWQLDTTCPAVTDTTYVNLFAAQISNLSGIQYFDNLDSLNCSTNKLTNLPPLRNGLTYLNCASNLLTSVPSSLPGSLKVLDCSNRFNILTNQITTLPLLPNGLTHLYCIELDIQSIPALPDSLILLDCTENELSSLPSLPGDLSQLYCKGNNLVTLPPLPPDIQKIDCSLNQLFQLPALPAGLIELTCYNNVLTSLPALPQSLARLQCNTNYITHLPELPAVMRLLGVTDNEITCLPEINQIDTFFFGYNLINCVFNYGNVAHSVPDIHAYPLCQAGNSNGCPVALTVDAGANAVICYGNNVAIGGNPTASYGTPPYSYAWSPATGLSCTNCANPVAAPLVNTTYTVTVTDSLGSVATDSVAVGLNSLITLDSIAHPSTCNGSNGYFAFYGFCDFCPISSITYTYNSVSQGPFSISSPGGLHAYLGGLSNGTYSNIQLNYAPLGGCTYFFPGPYVLSGSPVITSLTKSDVTCAGYMNGSACVNVDGGHQPFTYNWNNTFSTQCLNNISGGAYNVTVTNSIGCTATGGTIVLEPAPINASTVFTTHGPLDTVCLNVTGGTPPYSVTWSPNMNSLNNGCYEFFNGSYAFTITDNNACSTSISSGLTADAGNDTAICLGGSVSLGGNPTATGGTPPYTYHWNPPVDISCSNCPNPVASSTVTTTYVVLVTDNAGATATDTITVVVNPAPTIDSIVTTDAVCFGYPIGGSISVYASGGTPPYSYPNQAPYWNDTITMWGDGNGGNSITLFSAAGISPGMGISGSGIGAGITVISVLGNVVTLSANVFWASGNFYFTGVPDNVFVGFTGGSYPVIVTDSNSCSVAGTAVVNSPAELKVDSFIVTGVSCNGLNDGTLCVYPYGGIPPYRYYWGTNDTAQCISNLSAGTYGLTVTDGHWCAATGSDNVSEPAPLSVQVTSSTGGIFPDTLCVTPAGGVAPYTFNWAGNVNSFGNACYELLSGTFSVTVTDANGCSATSANFCIGFQVDSIASTGVPCTGIGAACVYPSGGTLPYNFAWSDSGQTATQCITGLTPGSNALTVTITDANSCTVTSAITIQQPAPFQFSFAMRNNVSCFGDTDGSACAYATGGRLPRTYLWSNGDTICLSNAAAGTYGITITDADGCTVSSSVDILQPSSQLTVQIISATGGLIPDTLSTFVSGGTSPNTFLWSDGYNFHTHVIDSVAGPGAYHLTVTDANGCEAYDSIMLGCGHPCVWPGDANSDGVADNNDLLPIGLAFGATGKERLLQDINWYEHPAWDWADTLATGVNYKHGDCNGDGTINAADTLAILQNFGNTHAKSGQKPWRLIDPALQVDLMPDTTHAGDTLYAHLTLGDISIPANNVYGLAFTVNYDATVVDSTKTQVAFGDSWLGTSIDKISIKKDIKASGLIKCAVTRIDHNTRSGYGKIGEVKFIITTDNINGKLPLAYYNMQVWISDVVAIDNSGNIIPVNEGSDSISIEYDPVGIANTELRAEDLKIQPNPASEKVLLSFSKTLLGGEMKVLDATGKVIIRKTIALASEEMQIAGFENGVYFIQVVTKHGVLTKRLVVVR